ncbi:unnamed protein product [Ectocarpus sp. CCAP 1310/34]|nr:unnamed protein product [Ectocarpus sp. CCAP 1310/34]
MRMEDNRLPKRILLGAMVGSVGYRGGRESDWVSRLGEDLVAFNMGDEKEGGKWKESAKDPEVWYNKVENGAAWLMGNGTGRRRKRPRSASARGRQKQRVRPSQDRREREPGKRRWGGRNGDRALL